MFVRFFTLLCILGCLTPASVEARHESLEAGVRSLLDRIEALRTAPEAKHQPTVWRLVREVVDTDSWLRAALPGWDEIDPELRQRLTDRMRRLMVARAVKRLDGRRAFRIEIEKVRVDRNQRAVDCLVHTHDAIYEIGLRWSQSDPPRLQDLLLEGVSIGRSDRRTLRRAWHMGGEVEVLAALDKAIARTGITVAPPAARPTTSPALRRASPD